MNMNKFRLGIESHNMNNANEIEAKKKPLHFKIGKAYIH